MESPHLEAHARQTPADVRVPGIRLPIINPLVRTVSGARAARNHLEQLLGDTMAAISLDQAARLTELGKMTITRAINCRWVSARRKKDGIYQIDGVRCALVPGAWQCRGLEKGPVHRGLGVGISAGRVKRSHARPTLSAHAAAANYCW